MKKQVTVYIQVRLKAGTTLKTLQQAVHETIPFPSSPQTLEACLRELCVCPAVAPCNAGFELVEPTQATALEQPGHFQVQVTARVHDEDAFLTAARDAVQQCWGGELEDVVEDECDLFGPALYELVLASSELPSPDGLGFEIVRVSSETRELLDDLPA